MLKPTKEAYTELQKAYDYFNSTLFRGKLPQCLITFQRQRGSYGYFSPDRFQRADGDVRDEIALNPTNFLDHSIEHGLSTLVHEMAHLWQQHFGNPGRGRYHNREWANKMEELGLCPTDTGELGGKKTGDRVSHYIIAGGPFAAACKKLLHGGFSLSWRDRFGDQAASAPKTTRSKFTCPECGLNAWAKPEANLVCGDCNEPMSEQSN